MKEEFYFVILFLTCISGQLVNSIDDKSRSQVTWCVISKPELKKCNDLAEAMKATEFKVLLHCKQKADKHECMKALDRGVADLVTLDPGEVFVAGRFYSIIPIMSEKYSSGGANRGYYSVAVVKSRSNISSLHDLQNRKVCFSGVGHMAGWVVPISKLLKDNIIEVKDCNNLINTVAAFVGSSCAPNSLNYMYNPSGDNTLRMCKLCAGWKRGYGTQCSGSDLYAGYEGAFKCLSAPNGGDVAFLTHTTVEEMTSIGSGYNKRDYKLLCPDGRLMQVDGYVDCNWGLVPPHAVVTSSSRSYARRRMFQDMLMRASKLFSSFNSERVKVGDRYNPSNSWSSWSSWQARTTTSTVRPVNVPYNGNSKSNFMIFSSPSALYGNYTSLMFQDTAQGFSRVPEMRQTFTLYLDKYVDLIKTLRYCPVKKMTLCVVTEYALKKCYRMRTALQARDLKPDMMCILGHSHRACMGMIDQGMADVTVLDAGDIYQAGSKFGLKPIVAEQYNLEEPAYYVVAVAQSSDPETDLLFLKGKKSCHTGMGTAAGWIIPINFLQRNRLMRPYGCNAVRAASEYFQKSCVPGSLSKEHYGTSSNFHNLCDLCHGSGSEYCQRDVLEPFYGHTGALRCLVEGGGEVAFFKHTTVMENTNGRNQQEWIRNMIQGDFELLCRDGTRASIDSFRTCNLGKVASNAIVTNADYSDDVTDTFINLFMYAQQYYGRGIDEDDELSFSMFASDPTYRDLIFQDATQVLRVIPKDKRNYRDYLGSEFLRAVRDTDCTAGSSCIHHRTFALIFFLFVKFIVL